MSANLTRDEQLRRAIRVYNELARIRKASKRAPIYERRTYERRAAELGAELRVLADKTKGAP